MEKQKEDLSKAKKQRKFLSTGEGYIKCRWDGIFVLGLGDRGAYHMGSKIAKKFNYFFPLSSERLYTVLRKRGSKVKHRKSLRGGGGSWFIMHLLERSISFNLSCGMRQ